MSLFSADDGDPIVLIGAGDFCRFERSCFLNFTVAGIEPLDGSRFITRWNLESSAIREGHDHELLAGETIAGVTFVGVADQFGLRGHFPEGDLLVAEEVEGIFGIGPGIVT